MFVGSTATKDAVLETTRLILRPPVAEDLDGWEEFTRDEAVMRFIGGAGPRSIAWRALAAMAGSWALYGFGMFSVIEKRSGLWIGRIGPWRPEGWPGTEIGWALVRSAWGKGYALEGASAAMDWAIDTLGWTDIIHSIDPGNMASKTVATRLGSIHRGAGRLPAPFDNDPIEIWGQTAEEWRARLAGETAARTGQDR